MHARRWSNVNNVKPDPSLRCCDSYRPQLMRGCRRGLESQGLQENAVDFQDGKQSGTQSVVSTGHNRSQVQSRVTSVQRTSRATWQNQDVNHRCSDAQTASPRFWCLEDSKAFRRQSRCCTLTFNTVSTRPGRCRLYGCYR